MSLGRLLVWLKPDGGEQTDVFIPASIAEQVREKLVLSSQMSTLIAIVSTMPSPEDEYLKRVLEQMRAVREAFEDASYGSSFGPSLVAVRGNAVLPPSHAKIEKKPENIWRGFLSLVAPKASRLDREKP